MIFFFWKCQQKNKELIDLTNHCSKLTERFDLLSAWIAKKNNGRAIADYLRKQKISRVGIYGLGTMGEFLIEDLLSNQIKIDYIVDSRIALRGGRYVNVPVISLDLVRKYKETGLMIIAIGYQENKILEQIKQLISNLEIITLEELIEKI